MEEIFQTKDICFADDAALEVSTVGFSYEKKTTEEATTSIHGE